MAGLYCVCNLKRDFSKAGLKNHQNSCDIYKKYKLNNEEKKIENKDEIERPNDEANRLQVKLQKQNDYLDKIIAENLNLKRRLQSLKRKKECQRYEKGPVFYVESTETRPGELRPGFTTNMTKRHREHHSNLKDGQGKLLYFIYSAAAKTIESIVLLKFNDRKTEENKDWMSNVTLDEIQTVVRSVMTILNKTEYREVYPSAESDQKVKCNLSEEKTLVTKMSVLKCDPVKFEDDEEDEKYILLKPYERVPEIMTDTHKKCGECQFLKPKERFDKCASRKDGVSTYCKRCLRVKRIHHKERLPKLELEAERTCQECNKVKQVKDFNHNSAYIDGYSGSCKQCTAERAYDEGRIGKHEEPKSEKTCTRCKELKSITEFSANRRHIDGIEKLCKPCLSERRAEYRERKAAEKLAEAAEKE
jgi:hypothetical protein